MVRCRHTEECLWDCRHVSKESFGTLVSPGYKQTVKFSKTCGRMTHSKKDITKDLICKCSMDEPEALRLLKTLINRVKDGKQTSCYTPWQQQWLLEDRSQDRKSQLKLAEDFAVLAAKWRHWKPSRVSQSKAVSLRDMKLSLRDKWIERLLAHLVPVGNHLSNILPLLGCDNVLQEVKHFLV